MRDKRDKVKKSNIHIILVSEGEDRKCEKGIFEDV